MDDDIFYGEDGMENTSDDEETYLIADDEDE